MIYRPKIAVTMGDPAGVGPELCLQMLADESLLKECQPIIVGDYSALSAAAQATGQTGTLESTPVVPLVKISATDDLSQPTGMIVDCQMIKADQYRLGEINRDTGHASWQYVNQAIHLTQQNKTVAIATAPIHKEAWAAAGVNFPGHTELFADVTGTDDYCMMMYAPDFSCSLVTTHIGLAEVPEKLTTEIILRCIHLTADALAKIHRRQPSLAMLGLNPHAGEGGLFGNGEEERIIQPAVDAARQAGIEITDPLPPDTAFLPKWRQRTDGYVCLYHDQGLIPFKAFNFDTGVNVTLGIPMVRTSVDHGTALDIAGKGLADASSMIAAIRLAAYLSVEQPSADPGSCNH